MLKADNNKRKHFTEAEYHMGRAEFYNSEFYHQNLPPENRRPYQPALGISHPIRNDGRVVTGLLSDVDQVLALILPDRVVDVDDDLRPVTRAQYTMYDKHTNLEKGMTVVEGRHLHNLRERARALKTPNDVGRLKGKLEDAIGRIGVQPEIIEVTLTDIARFGLKDENGCARKIVATVDPNCEGGELLREEHRRAVETLEYHLPEFEYPHDPEKYVPHLSIANLGKRVPGARIENCVSAVRDLLPVTIPLGAISVFEPRE
jgi:hypothetical protein